MQLKKLVVLAILSIFLSSCSLSKSIDYQKDSVATQNAVIKTYDKYKKTLKVEGPKVRAYSGNGSLFLRAYGVGKKPDTLSYQLYVINRASEWNFFKKAYDGNGKLLDITLIDREVGSCYGGGCTLYEHIAINLTKEDLIKAQKTGFPFRLYGKYEGGTYHFLSGDYIKGYLGYVNNFLKRNNSK